MDEQTIADALAPLLPGFEADGLILSVLTARSDEVVIQLGRTPDACEECIMPLESMEYLVAERLRQAGIGVGAVRVVEAAT
ncbi:MAG TPA: hypothetical protein VNJ51_06395 [Candidatus Dormibacteraeota bacterium]|nr:hypothetical protein [Candidatus Dormibacteraeota bacterium]